MEAKRAAAERAVQLVRDGMVVGLGSGSTAGYAIRALGERVKNGLRIRAIASSLKSERLARQYNIPVDEPSHTTIIDIGLDGADEVDKTGNLIKGGGGSLLREKIVAYASKGFHVIIDDSKIVDQLGAFPLPVEIVPFAYEITLQQIASLGCDPEIRRTDDAIFVTDNGNYIADCRFNTISDPAGLSVRLKMIPGVVETGLFSARIVTSLFIGYKTGESREITLNS